MKDWMKIINKKNPTKLLWGFIFFVTNYSILQQAACLEVRNNSIFAAKQNKRITLQDSKLNATFQAIAFT